MKKSETMAATHDPEQQWQLSDDRRSVRFHVPPLPMDGFARPLEIHVTFDAESIDQLIGRLVDLRQHMLPAPRRN